MTEEELFNIEQVLKIIEIKLIKDSNSCEFEFYKKLKVELEEKLCKHLGDS